MSLEATLAKAIIFHKLDKSKHKGSNSSKSQSKKSAKTTNSNKPAEKSKERPQPSNSECKATRTIASQTCRRINSFLELRAQVQQAIANSPKVSGTPVTSCNLLVGQILNTVGELENTLIEDHQNDFDLRMALERQTEKMNDLRSTLETERQRNERLLHLMRGIDSASSTEDDANVLNEYGRNNWQSRSSMEAYESISPLLMQQRYDELSTSNKQCRRQLVKKEKLLTLTKCEKEDLQAKYDRLLYEYRNEQKRFEELCCKYLRLQAKKNQEIQKLRDALTHASDCVVDAQQIIDNRDKRPSTHFEQEFRQNLQLFVKALRLCQWAQSSRSRRSRASVKHNSA